MRRVKIEHTTLWALEIVRYVINRILAELKGGMDIILFAAGSYGNK